MRANQTPTGKPLPPPDGDERGDFTWSTAVRPGRTQHITSCLRHPWSTCQSLEGRERIASKMQIRDLKLTQRSTLGRPLRPWKTANGNRHVEFNEKQARGSDGMAEIERNKPRYPAEDGGFIQRKGLLSSLTATSSAITRVFAPCFFCATGEASDNKPSSALFLFKSPSPRFESPRRNGT